jgi:hypothetical protein
MFAGEYHVVVERSEPERGYAMLAARISRAFSDCQSVLWLLLVIAFADGILVPSQVSAASAGSALKAVAEQLSKSGDEVASSIGKAASNLANNGDDVLKRLGRTSDSAVVPASADIVSQLRRLGLEDASGQWAKQFDAMDAAARKGFATFLEQSRRVFEVGKKLEISPDSVLRSLDNGGPEALLAVRSMKSAEGVRDCLKGFDEFGPDFVEFACKGDEAAVIAAMKRADEIKRLAKADIDDLLKNPAKHFDPDGKPRRAFDDLLTRTARSKFTIGGIAAATVYFLTPDGVGDALNRLFGGSLGQGARMLQWVVWLGMLVLLLWILAPVLMPVGWWLLRKMLVLLARIPGRLGAAMSRLLVRVTARGDQRAAFGPRVLRRRKRTRLRIGLLGHRRAGKSTFIVMLAKRLSQLVEGASLEAYRQHPDQELLDEMTQEVAECRPTKEDKTLELDLSWPFSRDGKRLDEGKLDQQLVLTDFPGEWAAADAPVEDREKLVRHLQGIDALLVVIDPTELEAEAGQDRMDVQRRAIEGMFKEDGLALGRRFHRALGIMFTKRDVIDATWLRRLCAQRRRRRGIWVKDCWN